MNRNKKYTCLSYTAGNIGGAVLLLGAILVLFLCRTQSFSWTGMIEILEQYCNAPLLLITGILGVLTLISYYETIEPMKISFGCTRKACFQNLQAGKFLTMLGAGALSVFLTGKQRNGRFFMELVFLLTLCLFVLSLCECMAVLHLRYRQIILIPIVCVSAMMGFAVAYMVAGVLKKGEITMDLQIQASMGVLGIWTLLLAVGTLLLTLLAWKFFRKAEIHI